MEFRPCIDIHNGKVKQIVGGSLKDRGDFASENFVSEQDSRFYADMYRKSGIRAVISFYSILWTASIMRIQRSRLLWRLKRIRRAYR